MSRRDGGMTIIELLISMAILLVIMAPLATSFAVGLGSTRASNQDAGNSADAQLLASFFDIDVSSAEQVRGNPANVTCGAGDPLIEFIWRDGAARRQVSYELADNAARRTEVQAPAQIFDLRRVVCSDDSGTELESSIVARTVIGRPVIECDGLATCASATPRSVTIRVTAYSTQISDKNTPGAFTFGITATRRVQP